MASADEDVRTAASEWSLPLLSARDGFARVIDTLPVALVLGNSCRQIELANRHAARMFGFAPAELDGQMLETLIAPDSHAGFAALLLDAARDGSANHTVALSGRRRDGSEFPLEVTLNPLDLDGRPILLLGVADVTARRAIEAENERQRRELARSNADLEEFAYTASHDLKAPLRAIGNLAKWIGEDIAATAGAQTIDDLRLLEGRVVRLQTMLDGLLAYSCIGHTPNPLEEVDIALVVRDVVNMLAPSPRFTVACEGTMPLVRTQRTPILVVLHNLIDNALKHHDRTEGHIAVGMRLADGVAEFRISDDGPGIAPQFHRRIFQIFQTLRSRDEVEGSGIGLAIVKKKVERHGGAIRVESAPPVRGATFVFSWREGAV